MTAMPSIAESRIDAKLTWWFGAARRIATLPPKVLGTSLFGVEYRLRGHRLRVLPAVFRGCLTAHGLDRVVDRDADTTSQHGMKDGGFHGVVFTSFFGHRSVPSSLAILARTIDEARAPDPPATVMSFT